MQQAFSVDTKNPLHALNLGIGQRRIRTSSRRNLVVFRRGGADTPARSFPGGGEVVSHTSPITSTRHPVPWSPAVSQKVSFATTLPDPDEKNE